jgi:glucose/arabinose dehydrogenase/PKD repeat protein
MSRHLRSSLVALTLAATIPVAPAAQGDATPPVIETRSPAIGATGVSTFIDVSAVFSEPIQPATLSMVLRNSSNQVVSSQAAYDAATRTGILNPDAELLGNQTFTVTVSGARDVAGNLMAQVSWSFTTATAGFQDVTLPQTGLLDPTVIQFASDNRVFVGEKGGRIWVYDDLNDPSPTVVANLRVNVYNFWDRGLLGMALHPNFPSTPYIYVLYAHDAVPGGTAPRWGSSSLGGALTDPCPSPPGATSNGCVVTGRLVRLNVGTPAAWPLDHTDEEPLIWDWFQQFPSHSIGALAFGIDGALYASGGDGASFTYFDYGQTASSPLANDPPNEGGALRSQDILTSGDPVTLDGSVIRIDPDTGFALPDNPRSVSDPDPNGMRIVAHGLRNPFRLTVRPGTREIWVGDVGWGTWEEINRIPDTVDAIVENFGWPCYEGNPIHKSYGTLQMCQSLYAQGSSAVVSPYYTYEHNDQVVAGEACPTGSSSISGLAFYPAAGGNYPSSYNGALFFSDYSRNCVWAMRTGSNGLPDPANRTTILSGAAGPVQLMPGPDGDIFYAGLADDRLHRIRYVSGNLPPAAAIQANPTNGPSPLTVTFNGTGSSDPEGQTLSYSWDLDADGAFDDSTSATPQWVYTGTGIVTARLRVSDPAGLVDVAAVNISLNNTAPTAVIDSPTGSFTWKVGDSIAFSGHGSDPDQPSGLPPASLSWQVIMHHCPSNCHTHDIQSFPGVSGGSFAAPDHEYPSHLELRLTVTDAGGLQSSTSVMLQPQTVALTFQTSPTGLQLTVNASSSATPFTRTVIRGSANSVAAPSPQTLGQQQYQFSSWSDGGLQSHTVTAPGTPATYTVTYSASSTTWPGLVAAYAMDEGAGTTLGDRSGRGHTGAISGATWSSQGRFDGALSFDGVDDWVTVVDTDALDLTTAMTIEAWIFPTSAQGVRDVLIKEGSGVDLYNLYARNGQGAPEVNVFVGTNGWAIGPGLPLNTWTHLAGTYDGITLRLFVNGGEVAATAMSGAIGTSSGPLRIGGNSLWGEFFQGRIDEVRVYNRVLSTVEIQADMNSPVGADTTPPLRSNGQPSGTLAAGSTQATLSLTTNENATCRRATSAGVPYASMPTAFTTTGGTAHATTVSGLVNGSSYTFYVRCQDGANNANPDDFLISFSVANPPSQDTTPPTASMTAPVGGSTVGGDVTVSATASDTVGVAGVQFLLGGVPLGAEDTTAPYSIVWNSTAVANGGPYQLSARARDAAGNQATATPVSVFVDNNVVTVFPTGATVLTGTLSSGTAAALASDDNVYYAVASTANGTTHTAAWYGSFGSVPDGLASLRVNYLGKNSANCSQTVAIWNWTTSAWVQLNKTVVGNNAEVAIYNLVPPGPLADYVSGTGGTGETRVRIQCQASVIRTSRGELMSLAYAPIQP